MVMPSQKALLVKRGEMQDIDIYGVRCVRDIWLYLIGLGIFNDFSATFCAFVNIREL